MEQFRYTIQERALELPQGGWEMEIDNPEELARGELKEEIGLEAEQMTHWDRSGSPTASRGSGSTSSSLPASRPLRQTATPKSTISPSAPFPSPNSSR